MCTSYDANPNDAWDAFSLFPEPDFDYKREIYKDYYAPILRRGGDAFETFGAWFGIVPRRHIPPGVKAFDTMNARSESVGKKRSFCGAWKNLQLCLVPCSAFFEPNYETGTAVCWRIGTASGEPLAIAGLWRSLEGSRRLAYPLLHDAHR
ncbi:SOS response-associated peptidase family protein [Paraburkholderia youngii]|uniref:SOS response-associated peptidase family protein n=1 Tax=Paraburkholderia youngii TaxID=2782701 RepID=UPI001FE47A36|nr:SOS response-associated peptidase family protein [Paraburkholderia youngii]